MDLAPDPGRGLSFARRPVGPAAILILSTIAISAVTLLLASANPVGGGSRPSIFAYLFVRDEPPAAWLGCALILLAAAVTRLFPRLRGESVIARLSADPRWFIVCTTLALAAFAVLVYRNHPLSMDEYAPFFQAAAFARLRLTGKVPPELLPRLIPPVHWFLKSSASGDLVSTYWPGFALLLTPFSFLRCAWLLNPLLGGASLWAVWRLAGCLWPGTAAPGWAVLLAAASPAFVVEAISFYSMPAHLLCSACFALLLLEPTPRRVWLAGLLGSFALVLHNPLPHTLFALPWVAWLAVRPGRLRNLATLALGYLPLTLLLGAGWLWFEARLGPAPDGRQSAMASASFLLRLAFAAPAEVMAEARLMRFAELNQWAVPALVPLACLGAWWRRREPRERLLIASGLCTFAGYLFVPYDQGHGWGDRYFHSAWFILPLFAGAALEWSGDARLRRMVVFAALASLLLGNGLRFAQVRSLITDQLNQIPTSPETGKLEVAFVRIDRGYYSIDLVQNDPFLRGSRLIFISEGEAADGRLMRRLFPSCRVVARGPVATVWVVD